MAYRVVWSPAALQDVEDIAEYIARDSSRYASAVVSKILAVARGLRQFPTRGRIVPEFADPAIRETFVYTYRLIYRVKDREVTVAAVIHGKRLLDSVRDRFGG